METEMIKWILIILGGVILAIPVAMFLGFLIMAGMSWFAGRDKTEQFSPYKENDW